MTLAGEEGGRERGRERRREGGREDQDHRWTQEESVDVWLLLQYIVCCSVMHNG